MTERFPFVEWLDTVTIRAENGEPLVPLSDLLRFVEENGDPFVIKKQCDRLYDANVDLQKKIDELEKKNGNICSYTGHVYESNINHALMAYRTGYRDGVMDCKTDWKDGD